MGNLGREEKGRTWGSEGLARTAGESIEVGSGVVEGREQVGEGRTIRRGMGPDACTSPPASPPSPQSLRTLIPFLETSQSHLPAQYPSHCVSCKYNPPPSLPPSCLLPHPCPIPVAVESTHMTRSNDSSVPPLHLNIVPLRESVRAGAISDSLLALL